MGRLDFEVTKRAVESEGVPSNSVSSSSSSDSTGLKMGDDGGKSEVSSSLMLRCLRMGLVGGGRRGCVDLLEERSSRSSADAGSCLTVSGTC